MASSLLFLNGLNGSERIFFELETGIVAHPVHPVVSGAVRGILNSILR
jgi:hypothetical protein